MPEALPKNHSSSEEPGLWFQNRGLFSDHFLKARLPQWKEWKADAGELTPFITECMNLLKGNWKEVERIIGILYERKKRILIPSDEDMEENTFTCLTC